MAAAAQNSQKEKQKPKATTMTDIKCPYCRHPLNQDDPQSIECRNSSCKKTWFMYGSKEMWQELTNNKQQIKKLRKQNRILRESLGEYFNKWIDISIQAIKDKDQIRVLTEQELANHQATMDQLKGLK